MIDRLKEMGLRLLLVPRIRSYFCKMRWKLLKKRLRFFEKPTDGVGNNVVKYNLTALDHAAAFGCGARMDILMYPLAAIFYPTLQHRKILIIGPRTEDDIFLAKALGFNAVRGLDLFSYSPHIDIGDMHDLPYSDDTFDAVILGWVLVYSSEPTKAVQQSLRVLKPSGLFAIGWEWVPDRNAPSDIRGNFINDVSEMISLIGCKPVFINDPDTATNHHKSLIFRK